MYYMLVLAEVACYYSVMIFSDLSGSKGRI